MKKLSHSFKLLMMTLLFVGLTLAVTGIANAEWYVTHGVSGQIQNEPALELIERMGTGLGCTFKSGANRVIWVHFAVPSLKGQGTTREIRVGCSKSGTEVTGLRVYNGGSLKFEMLEDEIPEEWKGDGWRNLKVNLREAPIDSQNGIGISVKVKTQDAGRRFIKFIKAEALFDENMTY